MKALPRIAAAAVLLTAGASHAQIVGGFGQRQAVGIQIRTGPYTSLNYVAGAYGFGFGPIFGPVPTWYYGWPGIPVAPNAYMVQPPPPVVIQNVIQAPGADAPPPGRQAVVPPEFDPLPAAKPAAKPQRAAAKVPVVPLPPPVRVEPEQAAKKPLGRVDADRLAEAGRKAFTAGQHGRALELFRRAAEITPDEPSAHFLVSQGAFALGKYREAVAAIIAGMAVRPDWPDARFVVRDLYWKSPELFDDHLKALRQAVEAFPNDPDLMFLLAHQLWFDGKPDEARPLFRKAAALTKGESPAAKFLAK
jgi:tetratricopeptide (TPR) repeat protein